MCIYKYIYIYILHIYDYMHITNETIVLKSGQVYFFLREGGLGGGAAPPPQSIFETPIFTCKVLG